LSVDQSFGAMLFNHNGDSSQYAAVGLSQYHWQPGFQQLPWKGLGGLLIALAGVIVSVIILLVSDGDDVRSWRFQPTVYISIACE
jgi:hypothetical protein